jgi:hypothetical protein
MNLEPDVCLDVCLDLCHGSLWCTFRARLKPKATLCAGGLCAPGANFSRMGALPDVWCLLVSWAVASACLAVFILLHKGEETWPCGHICLFEVVVFLSSALSTWVIREWENIRAMMVREWDNIRAIPRSAFLAVVAGLAVLLCVPFYCYVIVWKSGPTVKTQFVI